MNYKDHNSKYENYKGSCYKCKNCKSGCIHKTKIMQYIKNTRDWFFNLFNYDNGSYPRILIKNIKPVGNTLQSATIKYEFNNFKKNDQILFKGNAKKIINDIYSVSFRNIIAITN